MSLERFICRASNRNIEQIFLESIKSNSLHSIQIIVNPISIETEFILRFKIDQKISGFINTQANERLVHTVARALFGHVRAFCSLKAIELLLNSIQLKVQKKRSFFKVLSIKLLFLICSMIFFLVQRHYFWLRQIENESAHNYTYID